jgi:hydrogenase nickel insertion protein HypA
LRETLLVRSIVEKALFKACELDAKSIERVQVALGEISELDLATIRSQWREQTKTTLAEDAQLLLRLIRAEVQCMACFKIYHPEDGRIHCPHCGSFGAKILAGEEFHLEAIE